MQKGLTCGIEHQVGLSATCAVAPLPPTREIQKALNKYSLLLAPGLLVGLAAYIVFPPLDAGPLVAFGLFLLFLPIVLQLLSIIRKRLSDDLDRLRTAYVYSSIALLLLALLLFLNGWLDRSPVNPVTTTVIQKTETRRGSSTGHSLTVSSWRPGRSLEELVVGSHTYNTVFVGKTIAVDMHKGFFNLPWYSGVSSR